MANTHDAFAIIGNFWSHTVAGARIRSVRGNQQDQGERRNERELARYHRSLLLKSTR